MTIRRIEELVWETQTPSRYRLLGPAQIVVEFTGRHWRHRWEGQPYIYGPYRTRAAAARAVRDFLNRHGARSAAQ